MKIQAIILVVAIAALAIGVMALYRRGNDTGTADFRANNPVLSSSEAAGDTSEEIAGELLRKWLNKFQTPGVSSATRIKRYEINRLDVKQGDGKLIVSVTFSVMPTRWSFDNWLAGSGGTTSGSWIRGKFTRFAITKNETGYQLKELGPGPL